ncbi:hypothetical protein [Colwellia echini]|uniref:Bacterial surface antigen (D15) domain-containing protein n=1 Tax=Colwellia echini TaxID=1982103 RepID=A0ABY3MW07_9GAMM|nr:hypothetical protein [Colwellia echini]TYK65289.1 hypothetical protein CWS31_011560 [Colwellia echini]
MANLIPEWTTDLRNEKEHAQGQKGSFFAVPIPIVDPTLGSGIVIDAAYYHSQSAEQKATQPSSATQGVAAYTNNKSYAYGLIQKNYWEQDTWRFVGSGGYTALELNLLDPQYSADGNQLDWYVAGTLFKAELLRRFGSHWYIGGQTRFVHNTQSISGNIETDGNSSTTTTTTTAGNSGFQSTTDTSSSNGLGVLIQYDTRDSQTNAYKGQRLSIDTLFNNTSMGSTNTYQSYNARYRYYTELTDNLVSATEIRACAKSGEAPLWDYCTISLRGFSATNYLNKASASAQTALRWRAWRKLGFVAFVGIGYDAQTIKELGDQSNVNSYGLGMRYMVLESQRINFRVDYARSGDNDALYVSVGEAF